jgi:hypothetical protein
VKVKALAIDAYAIVGMMHGSSCPADIFLTQGDAGTQASRDGLRTMLKMTASAGLSAIPSAWYHEADKRNGIYEFVKGSLRLIFFKGRNGQIAVCTGGVVKKGQKADKTSVAYAIRCKKDYIAALAAEGIELVEDNGEPHETE